MSDRNAVHAAPPFGQMVVRAGRATREGLRTFGRGLIRVSIQMQYGRMVSVLNGMRDADLADMGITRSDIPNRAAMLVGLDRRTP